MQPAGVVARYVVDSCNSGVPAVILMHLRDGREVVVDKFRECVGLAMDFGRV